MSANIHADIAAALLAGAVTRCYPDAAPEDTPPPLTIFRRTSYEPVMTLQGYAGTAKSIFVFENWDVTKLGAIARAAAVTVAIEAAVASTLPIQYREFASGESYEPQSAEYLEVISFSFWHA